MIVKKLELYLKDIVRGRKKGVIAFFVKLILLPLSWFYGFFVHLRNWLYEKGWMLRYVPPVPLVISVGNIVAGGTGKTPVTFLLARAFYERYAIAILSRGYRSKAEKLDTPLILCEGDGPGFPASFCGDEPYLFAQRFPKAVVIVGGNRKKASFLAAKAGAQTILLDDGMQHQRLARDFDVVVVDAGDPFGQGHFLPRGFLRDEVCSLKRADLIILNHIQDSEEFCKIKTQLEAYSRAPVVGTKGFVAAFRNFQGMEVPRKGGESVAMFCAIGRPDYFKLTLENEGCSVVSEYVLADHEAFNEKNLDQFAQLSLKKGAKWLVCTEKDRVKLSYSLVLPLPLLWVQMELSIVEGQSEWENFLKQTEAKLT